MKRMYVLTVVVAIFAACAIALGCAASQVPAVPAQAIAGVPPFLPVTE